MKNQRNFKKKIKKVIRQSKSSESIIRLAKNRDAKADSQ